MSFKVTQLTQQALLNLKPVIDAVARHDRDLARQLRRSASSIYLNLAEAEGSRAGNQRKHFDIALGSAKETRANLNLARCWGYADANKVDQQLDIICAMLWRMTHRRPA